MTGRDRYGWWVTSTYLLTVMHWSWSTRAYLISSVSMKWQISMETFDDIEGSGYRVVSYMVRSHAFRYITNDITGSVPVSMSYSVLISSL